MRTLYSGLLAALFLFAPATASYAADTPPAGGIGIRLVDIPEARQADPRARSYIVDNLPPGTTVKRRVEVQNNSTERQSIALYVSAAEVRDGSFTGLAREDRNELTGWIETDTPVVDLAAGESAQAVVEIAVPGDAPEGEQFAVLWAEVRSAPAPDTQVVTASRVGIRVYLSVGAGNGPPAAFTAGSLQPGQNVDGVRRITAEVNNTGGRTIDVQGNLTLSAGPGGLSAGPVSLDSMVTIPPGESAPVTVTLDPELPSGSWHAQLDLKSGLATAQAEADLTFNGTEAVPPAEPGNGPALAAAVAAAVLLVAGMFIWLYRRRRSGGTPRRP
ncbi:hypothetical protein LJ753_06070 [Arthrobacter sp. zg-Y20]|uniref:hypothetical protein n=1 Tax=unclassified Arthrobacter TaxID=235627 RepID=UPI001D14549D|nr:MULTISPECIES: hypothetical protein [unclassified Arthrobacter]MCC3275435.1 hypothetical protein [Arthrobacter sp. zg-Y20]MDK1315592.1 hypothetical protein [Arthrobacter sp. zg.Y20]WIB06007.1 hypothetical protein QNO06_16045 [Arthrobacter sp. zg-Y20]